MLLGYRGPDGPYGEETARARAARSRAVAAAAARGADAVLTTAARTGRGLWNGIRSMIEGLRTARRRAAAIRELQALDDRMLADIGLSRSQIRFAVDRQLAAGRTKPEHHAKELSPAPAPESASEVLQRAA